MESLLTSVLLPAALGIVMLGLGNPVMGIPAAVYGLLVFVPAALFATAFARGTRAAAPATGAPAT